ncbi:MAG: hypothetical protein JSR37_07815 [Verrucomicrobia bacterium]|nr:hypothetical protein [Verrucomicrobiota bacterium]MBS0637373.1 hypothetical protein [Verrucomicrobiota bacterium]
MSCCIGRRVDPQIDPQILGSELKQQLQRTDKSTVDVFKSVMESESSRTTLLTYFEETYSPELPYYVRDFIEWQKHQTKEGAETLFQKYLMPNSDYPLDVENSDHKRIKFLLSDFTANGKLIHDMFEKYALSAMRDIKNSYNPKP